MNRGLFGDQSSPLAVGGWLRLLCALLIVWEPLSFAASQSGLLTSLADRGLLVLLVFVLRVGVLGLGVGAGLAIRNGRAHGIILARAFFVLSATASAVVVSTSFYPVGLAPDLRAPVLMVILVYDAAWLAYLFRSNRVRRLLSGGGT